MKLELIVAIENSICLICFTILAIVFHAWWIVLFSLLAFTYIKTKKS